MFKVSRRRSGCAASEWTLGAKRHVRRVRSVPGNRQAQQEADHV